MAGGSRRRNPLTSDGGGPGTEPGLWALRDFRLLWLGDAVSTIGSQITMNALPLVAVLALHGSGAELGTLRALYMLPFLALTLPIGLWLERAPRRRVMLVMDLGRAVLAVAVPVAGWSGVLGWPELYLVAVLGGAMTVVGELAVPAYLVDLVGPARLADANSGLNANFAVSSTVGPGLTGWLVGLVGAATSMLADALSYLVSAATLLLIRSPERPAAAPAERRDLRRELREGFRAVWRNPPLRDIAVSTTISAAAAQFVGVACVVYLVGDLGLSPGWYGLAMAAGGAGGILGTVAAPAALRRLGYGRVLLYGSAVAAAPLALIPASARPGTAALLSGCAFFCTGLGGGAAGTAAVTVRHLLTPRALHVRMNACYRLAQFTAIPVGAAVAGALVDRIGARDTLWICPLVMLATLPPVASAQVRALRAVEAVG